MLFSQYQHLQLTRFSQWAAMQLTFTFMWESVYLIFYFETKVPSAYIQRKPQTKQFYIPKPWHLCANIDSMVFRKHFFTLAFPLTREFFFLCARMSLRYLRFGGIIAFTFSFACSSRSVICVYMHECYHQAAMKSCLIYYITSSSLKGLVKFN